ncbi:MAG: sulfite exporter TauE/SafE family protein [Chloroflexales bacterium]|nr:sulfite exporter TauE/SafE family protein [Chloroflexales bacterium]
MVGTIRPVVYREKQFFNWIIAAGLHVLGNLAAAGVMGYILGLVGHLLSSVINSDRTFTFIGLGVTSLAYALHELHFLQMPYPQILAQVPASWRRRFHPYLTSLLYGLGLGVGITTRIATGGIYIVLLGAFLSASPFYGAVIFSGFGLGRGISAMLAGWIIREAQSGEALHNALEVLMARESLVHKIIGVILMIFSGYWLLAGLQYFL